ncbi:MAG: hypothetical protein JW941_02840 [Candidatus Coatesbacteria bacterium]|nr:hypothetical protein [Candidatus Coatesbacteria bacterium]
MSEEKFWRKDLDFRWMSVFWLLPWAYLCRALMPVIKDKLPLFSICQSAAEQQHIELIRTLLPAIPYGLFLLLVGIYVFLIAIGCKKACWALGILALCICLLHFFRPRYIDESPECRALGDCRDISTAILLFHKDTGEWPY